MRLISVLPLATLAWSLAAPRASPGAPDPDGTNLCCFTLSSARRVGGVLEEDMAGDLVLEGSFGNGFFCLDGEGGMLYDGTRQGSSCFIARPTMPQFKLSPYQFRCFAPGVPGPLEQFSLVRSPDNATDPSLYLAYHDQKVMPGRQSRFLACKSNSTVIGGYEIFSEDRQDRAGCREIGLVMRNGTGACAGAGVVAV